MPPPRLGSREASHVLARQMAPTYSHSTSEDAELGGLVMQVVGGAIRSRLARGNEFVPLAPHAFSV